MPQKRPWIPIRIETHIIDGCSDSRDIAASYNEAQRELIDAYHENGVLLDFQRISTAGTFVTPELKGEIKSIIFHKIQEYTDKYWIMPVMYIHVASHGNASLREGKTGERFDIDEIQIKKDCTTNCGMLHAREAAKKLQEEILGVRN